MSYWQNKIALVTGGSAGLGRAMSRAFAEAGASVVVAARDPQKLAQAVSDFRQQPGQVSGIPTDVTCQDQVERLLEQTIQQHGRLDVLVNNAGRSSRGEAIHTAPEQFRELWELNFLAVVRCTQAAVPHLLSSQGHVVNIGSLACKAAPRYLGAYPASKFPLAALSQQLRLELQPQGVHVLLVCPGPLARQDSGRRYDQQAEGLPAAARKPGGGVKLKGIDPDWLAAAILRACQQRQAELVVPAKARWLFALSQLWPTWGDRLMGRWT